MPKNHEISLLRINFRPTQRLASRGTDAPRHLKPLDPKKSKKFRPEAQIIRHFGEIRPKRVLTKDTNIVCRIIPERDKLRKNGENPRMPKRIRNPNSSTDSPSKTPVARHFRSERRQLRRLAAPKRAHSARRGLQIRIRDRRTKPSHLLGGAPCCRWTQDARVPQQPVSHDRCCRAKLAESFLR